jgi:hypothetical protein
MKRLALLLLLIPVLAHSTQQAPTPAVPTIVHAVPNRLDAALKEYPTLTSDDARIQQLNTILATNLTNPTNAEVQALAQIIHRANETIKKALTIPAEWREKLADLNPRFNELFDAIIPEKSSATYAQEPTICLSWQALHPYEMIEKAREYFKNSILWTLAPPQGYHAIAEKILREFKQFAPFNRYFICAAALENMGIGFEYIKELVTNWDLSPASKRKILNFINTRDGVKKFACAKAIESSQQEKPFEAAQIAQTTQLPTALIPLIAQYAMHCHWGVSITQILASPEARNIAGYSEVFDGQGLALNYRMLSSLEGYRMLPPSTYPTTAPATNVDGNFLESINLSDFPPNMYLISADNNFITHINTNQQLPQLWQLTLNENELTQLPTNLFSAAPALALLEAKNNPLTEISPEAQACLDIRAANLTVHYPTAESRKFYADYLKAKAAQQKTTAAAGTAADTNKSTHNTQEATP